MQVGWCMAVGACRLALNGWCALIGTGWLELGRCSAVVYTFYFDAVVLGVLFRHKSCVGVRCEFWQARVGQGHPASLP